MRSRYGAFLLGVAILAVASYDYAWLQGLGFPDGHLTELDRSRVPLHRVFIGLGVLCGLYFLYLAGIESERGRPRRMLAVMLLYLSIVLITVLIDWHLAPTLRRA